MVKPSDPEAPARRDGWLERKGTWGEVTIGSLLAGPKRTEIWEVTDTRQPAQFEEGHTGWFRVVNQTTGETFPVAPRSQTARCTFLMPDDDATPPPVTPGEDAAEVALLAEKLGALTIGVINNATGEIVCPDYAAGDLHTVGVTPGQHPGIHRVNEMEHLRVCHGIDTSAIELLPDLEQITAVANAHGPLHGPRSKSLPHGGFPHRHESNTTSAFLRSSS